MIVRHSFIGLIGVAAVLCASTAMAQSARDIRGPAAVVPLGSEPPPRRFWEAGGRVDCPAFVSEQLKALPPF